MTFLDSLFGRKKDAPPEEGNPALIRAMHEVARNDNAQTRKELYEAMLASMFLIPASELPGGLGSTGMRTLEAGTQLPLFSSLDKDQIRFTVAFTDLEALRNCDPNTPYLGLKAKDLFSFLVTTDIQDVLINPFDPIRKMIRPGGRVKRAELQVLATGQAPGHVGHQQIRIEKKEQVLVGLPANPPSTMIQELLRTKATEISAVSELYFFQMARGQTTTTVIGIGLADEVDENQKQEISRALGTAIQRSLGPCQVLDFMFLSGSFGAHIRKIGGVIFRRS